MYKGRAPAGTPFPFVVFSVISDLSRPTFTEQYEDVLLQFSLFSATGSTTEIEDMFTHLKALYDECALTITGSSLVWMRRSGAHFMVEDGPDPNAAENIWHYAVEYDILTSLT